jgi:hypothetical protein
MLCRNHADSAGIDRTGITLWLGDKKICGTGVVVSRHPNFGNGIKFVFLDDEGKRQLNNYLEALSPFRTAVAAR